MVDENISPEFRLRNIEETRNCFVEKIKELMCKKHEKVYSMLNYHDRLLMAQYPTGELFEYRGKELKRLKGWPPKLPGVSSSAREAQPRTGGTGTPTPSTKI